MLKTKYKIYLLFLQIIFKINFKIIFFQRLYLLMRYLDYKMIKSLLKLRKNICQKLQTKNIPSFNLDVYIELKGAFNF